jgi:hypothetical protein
MNKVLVIVLCIAISVLLKKLLPGLSAFFNSNSQKEFEMCPVNLILLIELHSVLEQRILEFSVFEIEQEVTVLLCLQPILMLLCCSTTNSLSLLSEQYFNSYENTSVNIKQKQHKLKIIFIF